MPQLININYEHYYGWRWMFIAVSRDHIFFRILGYGLSFSHVPSIAFSVRKGYRKHYFIGNWWIEFLRRGK